MSSILRPRRENTAPQMRHNKTAEDDIERPHRMASTGPCQVGRSMHIGPSPLELRQLAGMTTRLVIYGLLRTFELLLVNGI
jgi:hypothetical protein